jgi:hypothetical protein
MCGLNKQKLLISLHLCPGGPGFKSDSMHNKMQGKGCLEIPFPRPDNVWELSILGTPSYVTCYVYLQAI